MRDTLSKSYEYRRIFRALSYLATIRKWYSGNIKEEIAYDRVFPATTFFAAGCIFANFIALCMGSSTLISEIILDDS